MRSRTDVLETAILGLLNSSPLHGYELRKRLNLLLGPFRAFSYGTLYPALKSLVARGLIAAAEEAAPPTYRAAGRAPSGTRGGKGAIAPAPALTGRRGRIEYELTAEGKEHLQSVLASSGPAAWEDESFDIRFALFAQTDADTRIRILEGRRSRLTERLEAFRESATRTRERLDEYTLELQRHGLEQVEREVRWLDGLITTERERALGRERPRSASTTPPSPASGSTVTWSGPAGAPEGPEPDAASAQHLGQTTHKERG